MDIFVNYVIEKGIVRDGGRNLDVLAGVGIIVWECE